MRKVFFHERDGVPVDGGGRTVTWLMKSADGESVYMSALIVQVKPGSRVAPAHSHPDGEETVFIYEGNGKAIIGDEVRPISPGSLMCFPRDVPHMLYNTGDTVMKGICVYAPSGKEIVYDYHPDFDFPEFEENDEPGYG